jgi:hypothetical protein
VCIYRDHEIYDTLSGSMLLPYLFATQQVINKIKPAQALMWCRLPKNLYPFFWVISRRLNFICQRFGTVCSVTLTYKIQTPGNHPEESIQHSKQGDSLKSRTKNFLRRDSRVYYRSLTELMPRRIKCIIQAHGF